MASSTLRIPTLEVSIEDLTKSSEGLVTRLQGTPISAYRRPRTSSALDFFVMSLILLLMCKLGAQQEAEMAQAATLREAIAVALTHLELPAPDNPAELLDVLGQVPDRVTDISREALHRGIHESFFLARAHYKSIALPKMVCGGLPNGYTAEELDAIEEEVHTPTELFAVSLIPGLDAPADPPAGPDGAQE